MYGSRGKGFTLIELMIVVAVVGILAAIAYPSYVEYVQKSRRSEAKAALSGAAQALERYYTENNTYATATLGNTSADIYPNTSEHGYYNLSINNPQAANSFTLNATPAGPQLTDKCGTFSLNEKGDKTVSGGSLTAADCW